MANLDTGSDVESPRTDGLQVIREGMTTFISFVILVLAATTMWYTFVSGGAAHDQSGVEAYNRQKDIMLYALALFGTVTGYYLGRVPAEIGAKRAETAAVAANARLARTQDRLTETAAGASMAAAQLGQAKEDSLKASRSLKETTGALRQAEGVLSQALEQAPEARRVLGKSGESTDVDELTERLRDARDRIARALERVDDET